MAIDCHQLPTAGNAPQLDITALFEAGARADDKVTDGAGNEDLTRASLLAAMSKVPGSV